MSEAILINFKVEQGADVEALSAQLAGQLEGIKTVVEAEAEPEAYRVVGVDDVLLTIGAGVVLVKSARGAVEEIRKLVSSVKALVQEIDGLVDAIVAVRSEERKLSDLTEDDLKTLAELSQ